MKKRAPWLLLLGATLLLGWAVVSLVQAPMMPPCELCARGGHARDGHH